ncbi:MAG: YjjG family noncanonical pyrimidine nucleotidase [Streptococcus orisratti]|nr:YjjG family noncanonical pyrimidine nucleotidase [Streptococcus orisratti]
MSYKFLLFDLDHTLLDFDAAEDVALTELLQEARVADVQAYKDYYVPMNKALWEALSLKKISKKEVVETRFSRLFAHFGQEVDGKAFAQRYQTFLSQQGQVFDGAKELLENLDEEGYRVLGATNGIQSIQEGRLAVSEIGGFFERVFISGATGLQKPDKAFFDWIASDTLGFDNSRALMVGDSLLADIQGGNNAGIDTAWYNPKEISNDSSAIPTYTIKNYQELKNLLAHNGNLN